MHPEENLCVVLVDTRNPLNLGAAARAMSNFGFADLRAVRPYEKAWREAPSAVGATELMRGAREFATVAEAVRDCSLVVGTTAVGNREVKHALRSLPQARPELRKALRRGRVAVLFGSEKRGLSNEDLSYCHWLLRIPTREEHRSMNLGQAAAVVLYELVREKGRGTQSSRRREEAATMETVGRIEETLLAALRKSGYVAPRGEAKAEKKMRRMLRRFSMEAGDAEVLLGMARKILWKLEQ